MLELIYPIAKPIVTVLLMPASLFCLLFGYFLFKKKFRSSVIALFVFALFCSPFFSQVLIKPFEFSTPKLDINAYKGKTPAPKFIWVLGCWHTDDELMPIEGQLHVCSMTRVVQAVRFANTLPDSTVIFTGLKGRKGSPSNPKKGAELAIALGLDSKRVKIFDGMENTFDEANKLKQVTPEFAPIIAISSASHMTRLKYTGTQLGLNLILSPAEYISGHGRLSWHTFMPSASGLRQSERGIYEVLGNIWYRLKSL